LLIHGTGANDKNETLGFVHKNGPKPITPFWQIAQYLSERGLLYFDMIKEVLVQIIQLTRTYGEMLQSMI